MPRYYTPLIILLDIIARPFHTDMGPNVLYIYKSWECIFDERKRLKTLYTNPITPTILFLRDIVVVNR
jgi:hypothetical protein